VAPLSREFSCHPAAAHACTISTEQVETGDPYNSPFASSVIVRLLTRQTMYNFGFRILESMKALVVRLSSSIAIAHHRQIAPDFTVTLIRYKYGACKLAAEPSLIDTFHIDNRTEDICIPIRSPLLRQRYADVGRDTPNASWFTVRRIVKKCRV